MTTDALAAATTPSTAPPTAPSAAPSPAALAQARAAAVEQGLVLPCTRRALLRRAGLGTAVLGSAGVLAACGGTSGTTTAGSDGSSGSSRGSGASVAASEVPEGSAVVVEAGGQEVVLAQPTAGTYVAYSAVCTHQGGIVQASSGTQVKCPLHGSVFDAGDGGAVLEGPATAPLEALTVSVAGDQLTLA